MADSYISSASAAGLVVPVKAATIYAAHEASLFLGGQLIPMVATPSGYLQVPNIADSTAYSLTALVDPITADVALGGGVISSTAIACDLIASRAIVRDLGSIDPNEIGRSLGNAVAAAFDKKVVKAMATMTAQEMASTGAAVTLADIFAAVATIRAGGETGQLFGIVSTEAYAELMTAIGGQAYAGGDLFQGQALRSGYLGSIAGVQMFVSSHFTAANVTAGAKLAVFGQDSMRIAMQQNVNVEVARRAEAVGNDVVASLHAGVGLVSAARGVLVLDAA